MSLDLSSPPAMVKTKKSAVLPKAQSRITPYLVSKRQLSRDASTGCSRAWEPGFSMDKVRLRLLSREKDEHDPSSDS